MKFSTQTIQLSTQVNKGSGAIVTNLTLTESDVPDATIINSLLSGQSPRVRLQNGFRANGIPKEHSMSWADYLSGRNAKIIVTESPESIAARAKADPALLKALLDQLGLEMPEASEQSE